MTLAIRPDSWNFPLLVHVGGAMLLVAALVVAATVLVQAWRERDPAAASALVRFGFRTLLMAAIPSYFVMRIGAQWILSKEGLDSPSVSLTWLDVGFTVADLGGILLLVTTIVAAFAARRARAAATAGALARTVTALTLVLVAAYGVAVWAMTAKPT
jgi:hypothetical protein